MGLLASVIGLVSAYPYLSDVVRRKTKPHLFTWFVWGILTGIAFLAQVSRQAGAGSWITALTVVNCFVVVGLAIPYGEKDIKRVDWVCLGGAVAGLLLWGFTSDPLMAVVIVTVVDLIAYLPTLRKAYYKPHEETAVFFFMSIWKFGLGVVAVRNYSLVTCLFPAAVVVFNVVFVATLMARRRTLASQSSIPLSPGL